MMARNIVERPRGNAKPDMHLSFFWCWFATADFCVGGVYELRENAQDYGRKSVRKGY